MKTCDKTPELEAMPALAKKRGRPVTGQAMTSAQRQKAYRDRKAQAVKPFDGWDTIDFAAASIKSDCEHSAAEYLKRVKLYVRKGDVVGARISFAALGVVLGVL